MVADRRGNVLLKDSAKLQLAAVTFKAKHSGLPAYLHDDLHDYQPGKMLCTAHLLQQLVLTSVTSRAFTVAVPTVWNCRCPNSQVSQISCL